MVATIGRSAALEVLLKSIAGQLGRGDFEIIVVDESCSRQVAELCSSSPRVRVLKCQSHGLSANRNLGASQARGEWFLFTDDDCWFPPGWVDATLRILNTTPADIVNALLVDEAGHPLIAQGDLTATDLDVPRVWWCGGGAIYSRRRVFRALGGFDERLGAGRWWGSAEETDFLLRAMEKGVRCRFEPEIVVHHPRPPAKLRASARRMLTYGRGQGAVLRLHLGGPLARDLAVMARRILLHPVWRLFHERPSALGWSEALCSLAGQTEGFLTFRCSAWPAVADPVSPEGKRPLSVLGALALLKRVRGRIP